MYWALYVYFIMLVCLLVAIKLFLPSNYFIFSPAIITIFAVQLTIIIAIQWVRLKNSLSISDNSIIVHTFSKRKELKLNDIKGYETQYWQHSASVLKYVLIKPNSDVKNAIKIHPSYLNFEEIQEWVETNFTDLNDVKDKQQHKKALKNHDYGFNTAERLHFVKRSKKVARVLNFLGMLLLVFTYFPSTYKYVLFPAILVPLLAITAIFYFKGLIKLEHFARYKLLISKEKYGNQKFSYESSSVFTDVFLAIILPTILLLVIIMKKYIVLDHSSALKIALIIATPLFLFCLFKTKEFQYNDFKSYLASGFIFAFFYGYFYACIIVLNCSLDNSIAIKHESTIIYKPTIINQSWSKRTKHQLKLKGVEHYRSIKITVSKEKYESQQIGNSYLINMNKGKFDMAWVADNE